MSNGKGGAGLRGRDRQQGALRDQRAGAYDSADQEMGSDVSGATQSAHRRAQSGAEVRREVADDDAATRDRDTDLPLGLKRKRMPPYDKDGGRSA